MDNEPPLIPAGHEPVFFTDLDGTLLDHETYDWSPAEPALERLRQHNIPLILASSKTAAEIAPLRVALGFSHCPAIVENGSGVLAPNEGRPNANRTYYRLISELNALPVDLRAHFRGFADLSVDEIRKVTGLSEAEAELARMRDFSEPGNWRGNETEMQEFLSLLAQRGISTRMGGRFLTLSFGADKADRLVEIMTGMRAHSAKPREAIALGDAPNDIGMLEVADYGIIIPNPAHAALPHLKGEDTGRIWRAKSAGPSGWNESILKITADLANDS